MNPFTIGLPAFLASVFVGYLLREYSIGRLTALELGTLSVSMRPIRLRYLLSMIAVVGVFLVLRFSIPRLMNLWFLLVLSLGMGLTLVFEVDGWRKCIFGRFARSFVTPYAVSRILSLRSSGSLRSHGGDRDQMMHVSCTQ
jgi:hypothetical protein